MASYGLTPQCSGKIDISYDTSPVEVIVGKRENKFHVHPSILASSSEFFRSALKPEWRKENDCTIDLRDQNPELFNIYVHWLYTSKIIAETRPEGRAEDRGPFDYLPLARLYALGERLNDVRFQDTIINAIVQLTREVDDNYSRWFPSDAAVNIIYENTTSNSPARSLLIDLYVNYGDDDWILDEADDVNHEFLLSLSKAMLARRDVPDEGEDETEDTVRAELESGIPCKYHSHSKDEPCCEQQVWRANTLQDLRHIASGFETP